LNKLTPAPKWVTGFARPRGIARMIETIERRMAGVEWLRHPFLLQHTRLSPSRLSLARRPNQDDEGLALW